MADQDTTSASSEHEWQICFRCGGHFPGPGIVQHEHIYCCDKCARGPKAMLPRMLSMAGLLVAGGAMLYGFLEQRCKSKVTPH